jgi:hypothetical protein
MQAALKAGRVVARSSASACSGIGMYQELLRAITVARKALARRGRSRRAAGGSRAAAHPIAEDNVRDVHAHPERALGST